MFIPKREEVAEGQGGLYNVKLYNLYASPNIRRRNGMGGLRNSYKILISKHEGKRPQGRLRRRWEYNIRMDLKEIGWEGVDWMHLCSA